MERNYWLTTHKGTSWEEFHRLTNAQLASFPNSNWHLVKKMQIGDQILCYQAGTSTWVGLLEVVAEPFYIDEEPFNNKDRIWDNQELEFRCRVQVRVLLDLPSNDGVPMMQFKDQLSFYQSLKPNAWKGFLSNNPRHLPVSDGEVLQQAIQERVINICTTQDLVSAEIENSTAQELKALEGARKQIYTNRYERNAALRKEAIRIHGTNCKACGFSFVEIYGVHGQGYIEVHHLKPLSLRGEQVYVNPAQDMTVLCSNCHRMIHRDYNEVLTIEQLQGIISAQKVIE